MQLYIDTSDIHGLGVYCDSDLPDGYEFGQIADAVAAGKHFLRMERNVIGKYINHSDIPNCETFLDSGGLWIRLRKYLPAHTELTLNYLGETNWIQDFLNAEMERLGITILIF